jgi:sugar phosphate permease
MTIPGIVLAVACLFMREPKRGESEGADYQPSTQPRWKNYVRILKNKSFLYCCLGMAAMTFAVGGITTWMPTYVSYRLQKEDPELRELAVKDQNLADKKSLKLANASFGPIVAVGTLFSTILGGLLADWMRTRVRGSYFVMSGVSMIIGFGFFLAFLYSSFPVAWIYLFLTVFFVFANTGPTNTILANVVHPAMRQMAVALCIIIIHILGDVPSPWIISYVSGSKTNFFQGFLLVSGFILLSGIIWWLGAQHLERDTANASKMMDDEKQP